MFRLQSGGNKSDSLEFRSLGQGSELKYHSASLLGLCLPGILLTLTHGTHYGWHNGPTSYATGNTTHAIPRIFKATIRFAHPFTGSHFSLGLIRPPRAATAPRMFILQPWKKNSPTTNIARTSAHKLFGFWCHTPRLESPTPVDCIAAQKRRRRASVSPQLSIREGKPHCGSKAQPLTA